MRRIRKITYPLWQVFLQGTEMVHFSRISLQIKKNGFFYDNVQCKRQWIDKNESLQPTPKAEFNESKVMLCVRWNCSDTDLQFLNCNQTLNVDLYPQQLQCVHENLLRKQPILVNMKIVDTAGPHSARITQEKIMDLDWSVLLHPIYSPDRVSSDFYLFFFSTKCSKWQKKLFKNVRCNHLWKLSWAQKLLNFT